MMSLRPSATNSVEDVPLTPSKHEQIASTAASPDKESPTTCVKKLRGQIQDMKHLKADSATDHSVQMGAMAENNLVKRDACQAQYDVESDAQRHRNVDSKTANAKKVNDLSTANESKRSAMRVVNEAEIVEIRRQGAQGRAEHGAWVHRLQTLNAQRMAKTESDGARVIRGLEMHGRGDELRHKNENAGMNTAHSVDMAGIEQKHQSELTTARQNRADNLTRHNKNMTTMGVQHKHETDDLRLRQRNEVDAQGRANNAKSATQTANLKMLKGKNQDTMDDMCRVMRQTEDLEAAVEASTERYFVLADKVKDQRAVMRCHAELQILTETLLNTQMEYIRLVGKEVADARINYAEAAQSTSSLKKQRKHIKAIIAEQESLRRCVSRQMNAFGKVNDKLVDRHTRTI